MTNAIKIIKRDHRAVKTDYLTFKAAKGNPKKHLAEKIFAALEAHAHMEETIFYPAVAKEASAKARKLITSALAEHKEMKQLIQRFRREEDAMGFDMKVDELLAGVMHHVKDEESELLPEVGDSMPKERLEELGTQMDPISPSHGQTLAKQIRTRLTSEATRITS